jgi:hypothetical protein
MEDPLRGGVDHVHRPVGGSGQTARRGQPGERRRPPAGDAQDPVAARRGRFVTDPVDDDWQRDAFVGKWYLELTPPQAYELGRKLFAIVDELRRDPPRSPGATAALVSVSVLPVLEPQAGSRMPSSR